jgi:hypothetical protein
MECRFTRSRIFDCAWGLAGVLYLPPLIACQAREADLRETSQNGQRTHFHHSQVTRRRDDDACRLRGTRGTRKKKKRQIEMSIAAGPKKIPIIIIN